MLIIALSKRLMSFSYLEVKVSTQEVGVAILIKSLFDKEVN